MFVTDHVNKVVNKFSAYSKMKIRDVWKPDISGWQVNVHTYIRTQANLVIATWSYIFMMNGNAISNHIIDSSFQLSGYWFR